MEDQSEKERPIGQSGEQGEIPSAPKDGEGQMGGGRGILRDIGPGTSVVLETCSYFSS